MIVLGALVMAGCLLALAIGMNIGHHIAMRLCARVGSLTDISAKDLDDDLRGAAHV